MKIATTLLILCTVIISLFLTACDPPNSPPTNNSTPPVVFDMYYLRTDGETLPPQECTLRKLDDKVLVIHTKNCGACKVAIPILQELEEELGISIRYYDLSDSEERKQLDEFKVLPQWTPTTVIGCKVIIGTRSKEDFRQELENFLASQ